MKILLVEDEDFKRNRIAECVLEFYPSVSIIDSRSVSSAKRIVRAHTLDLVLMDMSLPNFDVTTEESGGRPHTFGGRELLSYMKYKGLKVPVIVITQFQKFKSDDGELDLRALRKMLIREYAEDFRKLIPFSHLSDGWKIDLAASIQEIMSESTNS